MVKKKGITLDRLEDEVFKAMHKLQFRFQP